MRSEGRQAGPQWSETLRLRKRRGGESGWRGVCPGKELAERVEREVMLGNFWRREMKEGEGWDRIEQRKMGSGEDSPSKEGEWIGSETNGAKRIRELKEVVEEEEKWTPGIFARTGRGREIRGVCYRELGEVLCR
jgi:hypothetical protein